MVIAREEDREQQRDKLQRISFEERARILGHAVTTVEELYAINGETPQSIANKHTAYLTPLLVRYIERSPFCALATSNRDGGMDVSPRGDSPHVARVLDSRTIVLADRQGNRRIDSYRNIVSRPFVGMLFIVPGVDETVRLNGRATVTRDPDLLASLESLGKTPKLAVVVEIDEVYMHCARAFLRSKLWQPESWPDPDDIPTLHAIGCEQRNMPAPDESGGKRQEEYRTRLY